MSHTYIVAADALVNIGRECADATGVQAVLSALYQLVLQGHLAFPPEAVKDCVRYAPGEAVTNWAQPTASSFQDADAPYEFIEEVLVDCPELLDPDEVELRVGVSVLALAIYRRRHGHDVCVVTNEIVDGPGTICIATACKRLDLQYLTLREFATTLDCGSSLG